MENFEGVAASLVFCIGMVNDRVERVLHVLSLLPNSERSRAFASSSRVDGVY